MIWAKIDEVSARLRAQPAREAPAKPAAPRPRRPRPAAGPRASHPAEDVGGTGASAAG
jgi:hypothetical protein